MAIETSRPLQQGRPELRTSREDRGAVVETRCVATGDGRLSPAAIDAGIEAALTARTHADLAILTAHRPAPGLPSGSAWPTAKDVVRVDCSSASMRRDGQRVLSLPIQLRVTSGNVRLDLTRAVITQPDLEVDVSVRRDGVTVITKPAHEVDTGDVPVGSDGRSRTASRLLCQS